MKMKSEKEILYLNRQDYIGSMKSYEAHANKHQEDYIKATRSFLERHDNGNYHIYQITITPKDPSQKQNPKYLLEDISDFFRDIQNKIFPQRRKSSIPEHLRPILFFFLDIPGSQETGTKAYKSMVTAKNGSIENLHAHGYLLLNANTWQQFEPTGEKENEKEIRLGKYNVLFQKFDKVEFENGPGYASKMIAVSKLHNEYFMDGYLYYSKNRKRTTPDELESFTVTPSAANTGTIDSIQLGVQ